MSGILKALAISFLLAVFAISLQGCGDDEAAGGGDCGGVDKAALMKCHTDAVQLSGCDGIQKNIDCYKDVCNVKAKDCVAELHDVDDSTIKVAVVAVLVEMGKDNTDENLDPDPCLNITNPCA
eukprot:gnl/TRDRNA2_/TRDRNA2_167828_c0_seq1.p1 gnl/TRDRNA2_/TRDRNA2_167828_c0~~gnl/TRDRNA2_/TRDRNA2_167828_c0_seq1.p1  ORF type:complete len:123 (+),score=28.68 gnl/TRDRNA2_/TRDRNA2_167828_c0_seq1:111-479(+)